MNPFDALGGMPTNQCHQRQWRVIYIPNRIGFKRYDNLQQCLLAENISLDTYRTEIVCECQLQVIERNQGL